MMCAGYFIVSEYAMVTHLSQSQKQKAAKKGDWSIVKQFHLAE